jgi:hypothetical protein
MSKKAHFEFKPHVRIFFYRCGLFRDAPDIRMDKPAFSDIQPDLTCRISDQPQDTKSFQISALLSR